MLVIDGVSRDGREFGRTCRYGERSTNSLTFIEYQLCAIRFAQSAAQVAQPFSHTYTHIDTHTHTQRVYAFVPVTMDDYVTITF